MVKNLKLLWILLLFVFTFQSCVKDIDRSVENSAFGHVSDENGDVPTAWYRLFLEIDRYAPGYRPPASARALAYIGLAAYETCIPGMPTNNSLSFSFVGFEMPDPPKNTQIHWPTAVNAAYAVMFRSFYPHIRDVDREKIQQLEKRFIDLFKSEIDMTSFAASENWGKLVANAVFEFSKTDKEGHDAYLNPRPATYIPAAQGPKGELLWQPTFPDFSPALFPTWGKVRTFAINESDKIAKKPLEYSTSINSAFYNQAKEVEISVNDSNPVDRHIAEFWSDDIFELTFTPAGRMVSIASQLASAKDFNLATSVEMYAHLGIALSDVAVAIWHSKYLYNVERPVSYIRRNFNPNWKTILRNPIPTDTIVGLTPSFPSYPSGHAGFAGAGIGVLLNFFEYQQNFTDLSHFGRVEFNGQTRTFTTLSQIAIENAYSRIPLGVHYRMDCDEGLRLGDIVATKVINLSWKK